MLFNRNSIKLYSVQIIYFCFILSILAVVCDGQRTWFANIFYDKLYVFQLVSVFLVGSAFVDQWMNASTFIRMNNRIRGLGIQLIQQYLYAFFFLSAWFILVILYSHIQFSSIVAMTIGEIINWYIRYFLGLVMLISLTIIFKRSDNSILAKHPQTCAYILLMIEVIGIIPEIKVNFPFDIYILFSWVFYTNVLSYLAMIIIIAILTLYLFYVSARRDIM